MRTDIFSVLVLTLWAATSLGTAHREERDIHVEKLAGPTKEFATNLMKTVVKQPGNVILSPLSVSSLLAMIQQGARESSATQLDSALHLTREESSSGYQSLISTLKSRTSKTLLNFGNSIFLNSNFDLISDYRSSMTNNFHATVESVDFHQPSKAAQKINSWVYDTTRGQIAEIIRPEAITGRTEMILVNTIYFKGKWYIPFNPARTAMTPFYKNNHQAPVTVHMMKLEETLKAGEDKKNLQAKWVELPYEDHDYALILILPNDDVDSLIQRMDATHINYLANSDSVKEVTLQLPRFKLETSLSLVPILKSLGVQDVFNQNSNLEGISLTKTPLVVSDVLHKAKIEVTELGTEASAASAVLVNTLSLTPNYDHLVITFDKPFLAIILDKSSKLPLFMAKVADPTKA